MTNETKPATDDEIRLVEMWVSMLPPHWKQVAHVKGLLACVEADRAALTECAAELDAYRKHIAEKDQRIPVGEGWRSEDGKLTPMTLKVGQHVLLNGRVGIPVFLPDQGITVWFLREREILAIVNDVPVQES